MVDFKLVKQMTPVQRFDMLGIVRAWCTEGHEATEGIPLHPEFIYRLTGGWQGWSDFLGSNEDFTKRDALEDAAFVEWLEMKEEMDELRDLVIR